MSEVAGAERVRPGQRRARRLATAGIAVSALGTWACAEAPSGESAAGAAAEPAAGAGSALQAGPSQVERGRILTVHHGCGDCHGGFGNPAAENWLIGFGESDPPYEIGPFKTRSRNITPDNDTGLGRFSERQIFNALRYGLRPGETPDVEITSATPGQGNFPAAPKYLAPPMPWTVFRHMTDQELMDIAAYLKRGVRPVSNRVADSEGPPDFWASEYTVEKVGAYPLPPFPTAREAAGP